MKNERGAVPLTDESYLDFLLGVCDKALPATALLALLVRATLSTLDAIEATRLLVFLVFDFPISVHPPFNPIITRFERVEQ